MARTNGFFLPGGFLFKHTDGIQFFPFKLGIGPAKMPVSGGFSEYRSSQFKAFDNAGRSKVKIVHYDIGQSSVIKLSRSVSVDKKTVLQTDHEDDNRLFVVYEKA